MKTLEEMNTEQLTYLKQRWSAEITDLNLQIGRSQTKLNNRLSKQQLDQNEIDSLEADLTVAQNLLTHLTNTSAPQEMIDAQQGAVDKINSKLEAETQGRNVLTDHEAYLQQADIDELKLQKQYRLDKIAIIDTLA